jgi:2-polyprenyl-6-methoxyphenol hydroxylase-like FAD-dependent oxidoreductase
VTTSISYPCGDGELLNLVLLHPSSPVHVERGGMWNTPATYEDCVALMPNFDPMMHELFGLSKDTKIHKFYSRDPVQTMANGKAVIIGDAAGPHQPQHAQGGTVSIECSAALGMLFSSLSVQSSDKDELTKLIKERTKLFDSIMRYRVHQTQLMSDCVPFQQDDPYKVEAREKLEHLMAERNAPMIPKDSPPFADQVRDILYTYNVVEDTKRAMAANGVLVQ